MQPVSSKRKTWPMFGPTVTQIASTLSCASLLRIAVRLSSDLPFETSNRRRLYS